MGQDLDNNSCNDIIVTRISFGLLPANLEILYNDGNGNFGSDPFTSDDSRTVNSDNVKIFPNPANLKICVNVTKNDHISNIYLYDTKDRQRKRVNNIETPTTLEIDVSGLENGIYFLSIQLASGISETRKIIVAR